jgi:hypothetical protein
MLTGNVKDEHIYGCQVLKAYQHGVTYMYT